MSNEKPLEQLILEALQKSKKDYARKLWETQRQLKATERRAELLGIAAGMAWITAGLALVTMIFLLRMKGW